MLDKHIPWHLDRDEECKQLFDKIDLNGNKLLSLSELILEIRLAVGVSKSVLKDKAIENA